MLLKMVNITRGLRLMLHPVYPILDFPDKQIYSNLISSQLTLQLIVKCSILHLTLIELETN